MQKCRQRVANVLGGTLDKGMGAVKFERLYWKICLRMFNSKLQSPNAPRHVSRPETMLFSWLAGLQSGSCPSRIARDRNDLQTMDVAWRRLP